MSGQALLNSPTVARIAAFALVLGVFAASSIRGRPSVIVLLGVNATAGIDAAGRSRRNRELVTPKLLSCTVTRMFVIPTRDSLIRRGGDPGRGQSRSGTPWASVRNWAEPAMIMMPSMTPHRPTMNPRPSVKMPRTRVRMSWMTATLVYPR